MQRIGHISKRLVLGTMLHVTVKELEVDERITAKIHTQVSFPSPSAEILEPTFGRVEQRFSCKSLGSGTTSFLYLEYGRQATFIENHQRQFQEFLSDSTRF